ncbi:MAG: sulfate adenylyltransferase subunit CysN [Alphaproteobacteria bacterium]|jgi:bifunctional enzyme CysN/CysC|uniref:sulfate adenylyltransferase subunit CysN n=1 Tax=Maricaulis alexandrii TaxID=2570354 RepID=UPI00110897F1|nr:sulfate adenylyltransferase subunit CysN [Maricaulis alexandrii]MCR9266872.1 sulfate adenylyltransferase subunit CysN [Alphaproteobacteria bacterium]
MDTQNSRTDVMDRLTQSGQHGVLRFLTCGSVDDGKSTLIGRLLFDSKLLFEDQINVLERDSRKHGTAGDEIDFALLLDGLEAEREQGITIDVAYRFFATEKRKFVVADTPGHEQYTRNMATGASTADVAVMMIDARKGVLVQTLRHTYIARMMGIRHIVLAVNKMDLVEHGRTRFHEIVADYMKNAEELGFETITPIPMSARYGDNVTRHSESMSWYKGPTLIEHLEDLDVTTDIESEPFRMPVQWVNRPNLNFRGYSGTIVSGKVKPGDAIVVSQSGLAANVERIVTADGDLEMAQAGDAVTLVLNHEIDISRGDVLAAAEERPEVSDQFAAEILWMAEDDLLPGRSYLLKIGTASTPATISALKHKVDINTYEKKPSRKLEMNGIGMCNVSTARPIAFDPYHTIRDMGAFILIDRFTNQTVGAGMISFGLRRASNIHHHAMDVTKADRAQLKAQKPAILWFTGLSGAGKSTVANIVERKLATAGHHTYSLDGDNVRHGLNRDLGFTDEDRVENIRRIGEVGKLFVEAGLLVTCSFISPFRSERRMVRELVEEGEFIEVFVDTPLEVCMERDPKGLYKKAKAGEIKNFTGFDSPYEEPEAPEIRVDTTSISAEEAADQVIAKLKELGRLG